MPWPLGICHWLRRPVADAQDGVAKGVAFLEEHWATFKEAFLSIATDAFYGSSGILVNAWSRLQSA